VANGDDAIAGVRTFSTFSGTINCMPRFPVAVLFLHENLQEEYSSHSFILYFI
jgi:hypothetical protein